MQITPSAIAAINKGFSLRFQEAFAKANPRYREFVTEVPSTGKSELHGFIDKLPRMREWLGERQLANLVAREFEIANKHLELSFEVDRDDIDDDRLGVYNPKLEMLAEQAAKYPDDLLVALMQNATGLCYDGQYFFDDDHPVNMDDAALGTQSNKLALALSATNYATARAAMGVLKGSDDRPMGVRPTHLVVPPQLEGTARTILNADTIATGETNIWKGSAQLVVWDELAGEATTWYLMDHSRALKPFIFQNRKAPEFNYLTDPNAENVFMKKKFVYGVDARGNAGYGPWFLALKSTP
jgi:phage major head subunit gpT-like protein